MRADFSLGEHDDEYDELSLSFLLSACFLPTTTRNQGEDAVMMLMMLTTTTTTKRLAPEPSFLAFHYHS